VTFRTIRDWIRTLCGHSVSNGAMSPSRMKVATVMNLRPLHYF